MNTRLKVSEAEEEIEGLDQVEDGGFGPYPIDTLLIRNDTRTVHDVLRRIEQGTFIMDPDFQRDFIWSEDKQSKLIESVLLRIPLPVFYLAENAKGEIIVVDGLQRLSTFQRFRNGELNLKLPEQPDLHKKKFGDLPAKLQNRVEDCNLILYVIDAKVPERARLDIFERVNSGVPLTRQQMRNSLFNGPATKFLKVEANTDHFIKATGASLNQGTMRDREFINRFCAFQIFPLENYRDMDEFLAAALTKMNDFAPREFSDLSARFRNSMRNNFSVFGKHAFRKHTEHQESRSVLNASLWDVMSTGLSPYEPDLVESRVEAIRFGFFNIMQDDDFIKSITSGTNDVWKVRHRFNTAHAMLREVLGA